MSLRASPNVIITGTPGVGKSVHCEQVAQETGLRHLSVNKVAHDRDCYESFDQDLQTWIVDEDKVCAVPLSGSVYAEAFFVFGQVLDAIEDELGQGGYLIDWHACEPFPESWIDLVVVLRCPTTSILYDRLSTR